MGQETYEKGISKQEFDKLVEVIGFEKADSLLRTQFKETSLEFNEEYKKNFFEDSYKSKVRQEFINLISGKEKQWDKASEVIVTYIKSKFKIYTTRDDERAEVWIYSDGIYIPQGKSQIKEIMRDLLGSFYSTYIYNLVIAKIEPDTYIDTNIFFHNHSPNEIPVKNGILNIIERKLYPFNQEKVFFSKLPVIYNPDAKCLKIGQFLDEVLNHAEDKKVYYEVAGFSLLKEYKFEKAVMMVGDGRNGKGKSLELLKRLVGAENCCSIPLGALTPDSFTISELFGKMINLAGDISGGDLKETSMFKSITGRDIIGGRRKFLRDLYFENYAKMIFACNNLPMVYDTSMGFWDRWILLQFPYTFVTKEEYQKREDKTNLKIKDDDIIKKIVSDEEMSGFLNQALDGLQRLIDNKRFSITRGTEEVKATWIRQSNSFVAFCMDNLEGDYEGRISKKELRKRYSDFCKEHKISGKSDIIIKRTLQEMYGSSDEYKDVFGGVREWVWTGIRWNVKDCKDVNQFTPYSTGQVSVYRVENPLTSLTPFTEQDADKELKEIGVQK